VELVRVTGKAVAEVSRDLSINDTTLGNWAERGVPDSSGLLPLTAAERAELTKLRRENSKLKVEREILKRRGPSTREESPGRTIQPPLCSACEHTHR